MKRAALVLVLLLPLVLAACGGGGTTITDKEPVGTTTGAGEGPQGELAEDGIGSLKVGASTDDVEAAFGKPDQETQNSGCELAGPNATPILQWTWNLSDGAVTLDFDATTKQLISYRTTSRGLPTTAGVRVGDDYATLSDAYGATLKPLQLGSVKPTSESGSWYTGQQGKAWLLFSVAGGAIGNIQGGNIQICE
jgi:hypothetical protein